MSANAAVYSINASNLLTLNIIGSKLLAYKTGVVINFTNVCPKGILVGNVWPLVANITPVNPIYAEDFIWNDPQYIGLGITKSYPGRHHMPIGNFFHNASPTTDLTGGLVGWVSSTPGAGAYVTEIPGTTTASTTATSATVVIASSVSFQLFKIGTAIKIAGVTFGTAALSYAKIVEIGSDYLSLTLDTVANQTVNGAVITWNRATIKEVTGMVFDKNMTAISTSGTGEDTLRSTTIPEDMMGNTSGFKIIAAGTKTGANGNKTLIFYFGSTAITFNAAANTITDWRLEVNIYSVSSTTQAISWIGWDGVTPLQGYEAAAETPQASDVLMKITGECADASDTITQTMWVVDAK